ncbi:MAG: methionyl-tRNA formyltransferase [Candidatus Magasanikbacteria bacterium]|nr:methionyl-tRNA formyltransferase [Candidatus Magasanikbacteria bacterium]
MEKIKIAFFGTQDFAATILDGLLSNTLFSVETVFTQPDRKVGRKQIVEESPVKKLATKHGLHTEQPESLKNYSIETGNYSLAVVAQYGLIIPQHIIDAFPKGMINVHGSLLPAYRGASPIQAALMTGEKTTGITIMIMDSLVDHGPILAQSSLPIALDDTYTTLAQKMAVEGSKLLLDTLPRYVSGEITPQTQDHAKATFTKLLTKDNGKIDFALPANTIYNLYQGLTPWPGIWCTWNNKRLKLLKIIKAKKTIPPGEVLIEDAHIFVGCGQDAIEILELQLEGKNSMTADVFANGYKNFNKAIL